LVVLGVTDGRRFGVVLLGSLADVCMAQNIQALGVGSHGPILDAVVDHFDEVTAS
jgi:hypothetical protein